MGAKDTGSVIKGQFGASARRAKNKRSSLCANGHHSWQIEKESQFDVKQGKLVTVLRCKRCGLIKNKVL